MVNGGGKPFVNKDIVQSSGCADLWEGRIHIVDAIGHVPFWEAVVRLGPVFERFLAEVTTD